MFLHERFSAEKREVQARLLHFLNLPGTKGGGNRAHPLRPASNRWPRDLLYTGFVHRILYTGFGSLFKRGTLPVEKVYPMRDG